VRGFSARWMCTLFGAIQVVGAQSAVPRRLESYRQTVIPLKGRLIGDPEVFAQPSYIEWVNGKLVVIDRKADSMIVVLDAATGQTIRRFGRRGSGPGEFEAPWSIQASGAGDSFWVFDTVLRRMTLVNLSTDFTRGSLHPSAMLGLETGTALNNPKWVANGTLISAGIIPDGRLAVFDSSGKARQAIGVFSFGDSRLPISVRRQAYDAYMTVSPKRDRVVTAMRLTDRVEIIDLTGGVLANGQRPFEFEPKFDVSADGTRMISPLDQRVAYAGIAATEQGLFALFSGRTRRDGGAPFANYVHVFSWTGELKGVLKLDGYALGITTDAEGKHIFVLREDPLPLVAVYEIPQSVSRTLVLPRGR
jgi:hypothetical protein